VTSDPAHPPVRHNEAEHRFEIAIDGELAHADYEEREGTLVFTHTWVPPALRGRGLAGPMVRAGLEIARRRGSRVIPRCSYVARYIERHPEYADLLADDSS